MKLRILSDIHLEHNTPDAVPGCDADVVILAGDIANGRDGIDWAARTFDVPVLYVPGNHEYYESAFDPVDRLIAIGLKRVERGCALIQIPEDQDGEVVYAYIALGLEHYGTFGQRLYDQKFWRPAGGDLNEAATPEILTRVRTELFKFMARWGCPFVLLDFSEPASVATYLQDWRNELEP